MAAITLHIPDKGVQMVRYYGWYSNKMRGQRRKTPAPDAAPGAPRPKAAPPPPAKLPSKKWRDLILQAWHTDPLLCPVCHSVMRVIAIVDNPGAVEKILRHLRLWSGPGPPPTARPPPDAPRPWAYEPCDDVDPMPDYENVLTD